MSDHPPRQSVWRNSIVSHDEADPRTLVEHDKNWKFHPNAQRRATKESLDELGWIEEITVNVRTGKIVDGHMRLRLALEYDEPSVPVTYVDLTEAQELKALLIKDPLAGMAEMDAQAAMRLTEELRFDGVELMELRRQLQRQAEGLAGDDEEDEKPQKDPFAGPPEMEILPWEHYDVCLLVFKRVMDWHQAVTVLELERRTDPRVRPGEAKQRKVGTARVLDGATFVNRLVDAEARAPALSEATSTLLRETMQRTGETQDALLARLLQEQAAGE